MPIEGAPARGQDFALPMDRSFGAPGDLLDDHLTIACQQGAIRVLNCSAPVEKPMEAEDFLRGTPLKPPMRLA